LNLLECRRKSSVISNLSNDDTGTCSIDLDMKITKNITESDMPKEESEEEKFLYSTRVTVLKLIREEEI
jgi:hypothetical protein